MSNTYFQFKQFIINQDNCAMKVCTDSCLFGAWIVQLIKDREMNVSNALDIGSGTGLLSLMVAQHFNIKIDAIEIDTLAANQAKDNVSISSWPNSINIINTSMQSFNPNIQYDFIFSNPPFFEDDLQSNDESKNAAKHSTTLTLTELINFIKNNSSGFSAIIIPSHRYDYIESILNNAGLFINEMMFVKQTTKHDYFRAMLLFSKNKSEKKFTEICIYDENRIYTKSFTELLKEYYLNF